MVKVRKLQKYFSLTAKWKSFNGTSCFMIFELSKYLDSSIQVIGDNLVVKLGTLDNLHLQILRFRIMPSPRWHDPDTLSSECAKCKNFGGWSRLFERGIKATLYSIQSIQGWSRRCTQSRRYTLLKPTSQRHCISNIHVTVHCALIREYISATSISQCGAATSKQWYFLK
jgi:hypothetical protein